MGDRGLDEYLNKEYCDKVRTLADSKKILLCDLHAVFMAETKKDPEQINKIISGDGVHLTAEGYELTAKHANKFWATLVYFFNHRFFVVHKCLVFLYLIKIIRRVSLILALINRIDWFQRYPCMGQSPTIAPPFAMILIKYTSKHRDIT